MSGNHKDFQLDVVLPWEDTARRLTGGASVFEKIVLDSHKHGVVFLAPPRAVEEGMVFSVALAWENQQIPAELIAPWRQNIGVLRLHQEYIAAVR